jgi:predicted nucleotidyltransferase
MSPVDRATAERSTILRGLVGSTVHGLNVNDGIEDRDEMGICVEPIEEAMALWDPFEQFIYRSAAEREGRQNARSTGGDLDLTIYSLRKWTRLALKGNPTIMLLLFTPEDQLVYRDELGTELRALTPAIVSRRVQGPFLGYLQAQKQRLTGERGQKRIHRPELEEMYGFDTKYAMHMLRLGFQGVELLTTGRLSLPMREPERSFLLDVRRGKVGEEQCLTRAGELEAELAGLATTSRLPAEPEEERVQRWVIDAYRRRWDAARREDRLT